MEILKTTDYSKFDTITGNRVINKKKIKNLVNDIGKGLNLLPYCPIICYESEGLLKIVDGQHRFETSKELDHPVHYVICNELDLKQVALLNSRSDKWSTKDFLNCYVEIGIKDYEILRDFTSKYKLSYSTAVELLMSGKTGGSNKPMDMFRNGEFVCNHLELATELVEITLDVFNLYTFNRDRYLIAAVHQLKNKGLCDFDVLKQKVKSAPMLMDKQPSWKDYIYNIERVYNHNNQKRQVIF